ncbi:hypothetical protein LXL04_018924 [Taraxacum kok-saghyz]
MRVEGDSETNTSSALPESECVHVNVSASVTASPSSSTVASPSGKRSRDPEDEVYVDNVHSHKRSLSEMMASSSNGLSVGDSLLENLMDSPARSESMFYYLRYCESNTCSPSPSQTDSQPTIPVSFYRCMISKITAGGDEAQTKTKTKKKKKREARFAFMTRTEIDHLDDGYRWRKYGQKAVKNSPFPRSYYRCTSASCNVKKRVERCMGDPAFVTTYEGQHIHSTPSAAPTRIPYFNYNLNPTTYAPAMVQGGLNCHLTTFVIIGCTMGASVWYLYHLMSHNSLFGVLNDLTKLSIQTHLLPHI